MKELLTTKEIIFRKINFKEEFFEVIYFDDFTILDEPTRVLFN
jgi:hypothetical protein